MAALDSSDGCPPGQCNCGCSTSPCRSCETINTAPSGPGKAASPFYWCVTRPNGLNAACFPWPDNAAACAYAVEHGYPTPTPQVVSDPSVVAWPLQTEQKD